jgi:hypothetical protein
VIPPQAGNSADSGQQVWNQKILDGLCSDCTVLNGRISLETADSKPVTPKDGVYIHHVLTFDASKPAIAITKSCAEDPLEKIGAVLGSKFVGAGEDNNDVLVWYTQPNGGHNGGFHIGPKHNFTVNVDLVNYSKEPAQVYLAVELEYLKGRVGTDSSERLISVIGCDVPDILTDPKGPITTTSYPHTFQHDGEIILAKGHMHVS